jgi:DNA-binding transcriptional LysR family regulator
MPSPPFTLRQLEVFASLANSGSFRAAATLLGVSQASISNQLKALEDQLGVRLFARTPGRSPRLTAEGVAFNEDLRAFDKASRQLASHRRKEPLSQAPVRFRLLVGQGMFDGYVRHKLDRFSADNPMIELEFETRPPANTLSSSISGAKFDFALINLRKDFVPNRMLERLARVRGGIYGHRRYLTGNREELSAEEVSQLPFVLPLVGSKHESEVLQTMSAHGIRPTQVVCHTQYYYVMTAMVERGLAVGPMSDALLPLASRETVVCLTPMPDWYLTLVHKQETSDPRAEIVVNFLKDAVIGDPAFPAIELFMDTAGRG